MTDCWGPRTTSISVVQETGSSLLRPVQVSVVRCSRVKLLCGFAFWQTSKTLHPHCTKQCRGCSIGKPWHRNVGGPVSLRTFKPVRPSWCSDFTLALSQQPSVLCLIVALNAPSGKQGSVIHSLIWQWPFELPEIMLVPVLKKAKKKIPETLGSRAIFKIT